MKIAIIGGGIVGSVAAFYLSQTEHEITLFDEGTGQATKAAAGIICPWFSKRRNQAWYQLANKGAHFFPTFLHDLAEQGIHSNAYQQRETWLVKKRPDQIASLYAFVKQRQQEAPLIQEVVILTPKEQRERLPEFHYDHEVLSVKGGAVIDGALLCSDLLTAAQANGLQVQATHATLSPQAAPFLINGTAFERVIVAAGAWLPHVLSEFPCEVDIVPQKGQLAVYHNRTETKDWPLIMPESAADIIPHPAGTLYLGATHEKNVGYDLTVDEAVLHPLLESVQDFLPDLATMAYDAIKVGTRAYTSDFSPFYGEVAHYPHLYVASGLGASGLTTGPLIGHELAKLALDEIPTLPTEPYRPDPYITFN
ncbi:MAG: FAD-dependent oxidoreductase [Aerococcus sp.]|nr:FAD-dependent oxidoreductase [Aerococcus sp.]